MIIAMHPIIKHQVTIKHPNNPTITVTQTIKLHRSHSADSIVMRKLHLHVMSVLIHSANRAWIDTEITILCVFKMHTFIQTMIMSSSWREINNHRVNQLFSQMLSQRQHRFKLLLSNLISKTKVYKKVNPLNF